MKARDGPILDTLGGAQVYKPYQLFKFSSGAQVYKPDQSVVQIQVPTLNSCQVITLNYCLGVLSHEGGRFP